jgi:hypothetical protein
MEIGNCGRLANSLYIKGPSAQWAESSVVPADNGPLQIKANEAVSYSFWLTALYQNTNALILSNAAGAGPTAIGFYISTLALNSTTYKIYYQIECSGLTGLRHDIQSDYIFKYGLMYNFVVVKTSNPNSAGWDLYANGLLVTSTRSNTTVTPNNVNGGKYYFGKPYATGLDYTLNYYLHSFKLITRAITLAEIAQEYAYDSKKTLPDTEIHLLLNERNGKTLKDKLDRYTFNLMGYSDAETANAGQPQRGNTAWVKAYTLLPINV